MSPCVRVGGVQVQRSGWFSATSGRVYARPHHTPAPLAESVGSATNAVHSGPSELTTVPSGICCNVPAGAPCPKMYVCAVYAYCPGSANDGFTTLMPVEEPSFELDSLRVENELLSLYSNPAEPLAPKPSMLTLAETVDETSNDCVDTEPLVTLAPEPWLQLTLTMLPELSVAQIVAGSAVSGAKPA